MQQYQEEIEKLQAAILLVAHLESRKYWFRSQSTFYSISVYIFFKGLETGMINDVLVYSGVVRIVKLFFQLFKILRPKRKIKL